MKMNDFGSGEYVAVVGSFPKFGQLPYLTVNHSCNVYQNDGKL
jgi:hypothetical protein